MNPELDDAKLVDRARSGCLASFDELMQRHERAVYGTARLYGRSHEDALDITQNVFLKAFRGIGRFEGRSRFKTWLLRITYNEGVSWTRRVKPEDQLPEDLPQLIASAEQEGSIMAGELRRLLAVELGRLRPRSRTAVALRYFREMKIREIADVLECSEGNVKNMLFRSLRKLRSELETSIARPV